MVTFCISLLCLVLGYVFYGAVVEKVFGVEPDRPTPCYTQGDGVDYIPLPTWKVFLIQFLNIAGTGPIFGAIMGILYGPAAYLWIVLGCIFVGATHDYMSGMISLRKGGTSISEFVGDELGAGVRLLMRVFSMVLLVLVAAVFVATPASLLSNMTLLVSSYIPILCACDPASRECPDRSHISALWPGHACDGGGSVCGNLHA